MQHYLMLHLGCNIVVSLFCAERAALAGRQARNLSLTSWDLKERQSAHAARPLLVLSGATAARAWH